MAPHIVDVDRRHRERAREARARGKRPQALLWRELKGKRMLGYDFDRDHPIDRCNVQFYCSVLKLAVEVERIVRDDARALRRRDRRHARLDRLGIGVLRFTDDEVMHNLDGVIGSIRRWIRNWPAKRGAGRACTSAAYVRFAPGRARASRASTVARSVAK